MIRPGVMIDVIDDSGCTTYCTFVGVVLAPPLTTKCKDGQT